MPFVGGMLLEGSLEPVGSFIDGLSVEELSSEGSLPGPSWSSCGSLFSFSVPGGSAVGASVPGMPLIDALSS